MKRKKIIALRKKNVDGTKKKKKKHQEGPAATPAPPGYRILVAYRG